MAKAVNLFINSGIFFDVGVGTSDISLWLVIVEVGNEIVNLIFWEELAEFRIELRGQSFVMRKH